MKRRNFIKGIIFSPVVLVGDRFLPEPEIIKPSVIKRSELALHGFNKPVFITSAEQANEMYGHGSQISRVLSEIEGVFNQPQWKGFSINNNG